MNWFEFGFWAKMGQVLSDFALLLGVVLIVFLIGFINYLMDKVKDKKGGDQ